MKIRTMVATSSKKASKVGKLYSRYSGKRRKTLRLNPNRHSPNHNNRRVSQMPNKNYLIGYRFERRVIKTLEEEGYLVFRQGKSKFPDLIAIKDNDGHIDVKILECKVRKYLSKEEKEEARRIHEKTGIPLTVYYRKDGKIEKYMVEKWTTFNL